MGVLWNADGKTAFASSSPDVPRTPLLRHANAAIAHPLRQDNARALGLNVIRTWAFCDGKRSGALQPAAGKFDEHVFTGFDWVIAEAAKRDIRLILTLTNYWDDFGAQLALVSSRTQQLCVFLLFSGSQIAPPPPHRWHSAVCAVGA